MRRQFLIPAVLILLATGCTASRPSAAGPTMVSGQAFVKEWEANLSVGTDYIKSLHVHDKSVIAYTQGNRGYWLSATGGQLLGSNPITRPGHTVHPPVVLADYTVIPTSISLETFDKTGKRLDTFIMPTAIQSPAAGSGSSVYLGVSHPGSGRLGRFDVGNRVNVGWEMYTSDGVVAAPAVYNETIFAGGLDGRVWAVTSNRLPIWSLPNNAFETNGPITADLVADDHGLYVASHDKRLYCLDRNSGKIKWMYFGEYPLTDAPVATSTQVFQLVPNVGLVAINKAEGKHAREPMWIQPIAQQVLAADDSYVYVRSGRGAVMALDKTTGEPVFQSTRGDLDVFATNVKGSIIYAATRHGTILAIKPILKPGTVGEIVWNDKLIGEVIAMAD